MTISFNADWDVAPIFYVNGVPVALDSELGYSTGKNAKYFDATAVYIMDNKGASNLHEAEASMTDLAFWNTYLTQEDVLDLYSNDGNALSKFPSSLVDYWKLGTEPSLKGIAVGSGIPFGTSIRSDIGRNALVAAHNLSCSAGPYNINTFEDVNQYDNMNYTSLLPRSDFQYSWIRQSLSGSDWMKRQRLRGYAPKDGKMTVVGGGSLVKEVNAYTWDLISDVSCEGPESICEDTGLPTITLHYTDGNGAQSTTAASVILTYVANGTAGANEVTPETVFGPVASWSKSFSTPGWECCTDLQYAMILRGSYDGGTRATYQSAVWSTSVVDATQGFRNNLTIRSLNTTPSGEAGVEVYMRIGVRCGEGDLAETWMEIKLIGGMWQVDPWNP